jgi:predicted DNA-binding transcriptional regulator YafY
MEKIKPLLGRLQLIHQELREKSYPNSTTLAKKHEVTQRTILRDIEYMRTMLDAPIEYDNKRRGFHYTEDNYEFPGIRIRESDLFAICIAEKALELYAGTPLYDKLSAVFEKIRSFLPDSVTVKTGLLDDRFTFLQESATRINEAIWDTVAEGLRTGRKVEIIHQKAGGEEPTTRRVSPYHIVNFRGEWYLVGHCSMRDSVVRFAMSRIRSARVTNEAFKVPGEFRIADFLGDHFGIMTEDREYRVRVRFSREQAPYVEERTWHGAQTIERNGDGTIVLSFPANSLFEVKRWVLSWGADARVLEPDILVRQVRDELDRAAGRYT